MLPGADPAGAAVPPGNLLSWGSDGDGRLGDGGTNDAQFIPVAVSGLGISGDVVAVSGGGAHSLALLADGSVLAWGDDASGQLGDDAPLADKAVPTAVSGLGPGSGVVAIAAGSAHSLAVRADGSVLAWGSDEFGQVGDGGGNTNQPIPVAVTGLGAGSGVVEVAAGGTHSLARRADGSLLAWGANGHGQIGNGFSCSNCRTPVSVTGRGAGTGTTAIAAGALHSLAIVGDSPAVPSDFDGNGRTDIAVPGDSNGDGVTDRAIFRPSSGRWYIEGAVGAAPAFGLAGDLPVPGDYDGDGRDDIAVYRPTTGRWFTRTPASTIAHGIAGDIPVTADINGDGIDDRTIFRPSTGRWYTHGVAGSAFLGQAGDIPVVGQYDADLALDRAVYRPTNGGWYIEGAPGSVVFGLATDRPVPIGIAARVLRYGA